MARGSLPSPIPFRCRPSTGASPRRSRQWRRDGRRLSFHCLGDSGGVKNPEPQRLVERGLEQSLQQGNIAPSLRGASMAPSFCYHLGDVIYYNGETSEYFAQFYDPYEHYPLPIVAIPGNHDGEPLNAQDPFRNDMRWQSARLDRGHRPSEVPSGLCGRRCCLEYPQAFSRPRARDATLLFIRGSPRMDRDASGGV